MFTEQIATKKDITDFLALSDEFSTLLFDTHGTFQEKLDHVFPERWNTAIKQYFVELKVDTANPSRVEEALRELKERLIALPSVTVELAIDPTPEMIKMIRNTFVELKLSASVLEISVRPDIIAGVRITSNGRYKDYSVKRHLEELSTKNKQTTT